MRRLLVVTPYVSPRYGGPAQSVTATAAALAARGMRVDLVSTDAHGREALPGGGGWVERAGYRYRLFPRTLRVGPFWSAPLASWVRAHVREYDLVHVQTVFNHPSHAAQAAAARAGVPFLVTPRGMLEPWALEQRRLRKRLHLARGGRRLLQAAACVQALVRKEEADIQAVAPGARTTTIPNGVTGAELDAPRDAGPMWERFPALLDRRLILFLSRVHRKKGLDVLAPALAAVRREVPEAHLVVAGPDDGYEGTARRMFDAAGCGDAVSFVGLLDGVMKKAALAACEVYALPSYSEGFSMSVLEAMAAGKPCVITHGCNFPEAADAGVARVVPAESGPFGEALLACLRDPASARAMGEAARGFVREHYTWDRVAEQLERLYEEILVRNVRAEREAA